jgi:tetratricopeptide (TPR) repeat protein
MRVDLTSPELIERFNRAARLAREEKYAESLEEWERLLGPRGEDEPSTVISGRFWGVAMMRKAWVLMDLGRYREARQLFEDGVIEACLGQFEMEELYEYFFSYGNTLGELGDLEGMGDMLSRALSIAAEKLRDPARCRNARTGLRYCHSRAQTRAQKRN